MSGFNLDTSPPYHMPSMYSLVESGCLDIAKLITFASSLHWYWYICWCSSKSEHERLCELLSCFGNKSQICWIRSRFKFLALAKLFSTLLHIFTLLVFLWILNGAMITFVVEENHVGFVIALRKFKNSILNFVVGYSVKRPAGIQYKILLQNILLWIVC